MMNFALTEEQLAIRESIDRMMAAHLPPDAVRDYDARGECPPHLLGAFGDLGILAIPFPARFGGLDGDWVTVTLVQERLGYHAAIAASLYSITVDFGGMSLLTYGSQAQQAALLPPLIRGEAQFSLALSEPGAGTDAAALVTRAERTGQGWRINGRKTWISSADSAAYLVTVCRSTRGSIGRDGISILLVPPTTPGVHMTKLHKLGNNSLTSWDIAFDDVVVPDDALLGQEGRGFRHVMSTLQYSRSGQAANAVGQAQAAVDMTVAHAKERVQFGKPLTQFQVLRHRLVDMQARVDQARLMLYRLAWLMATGQPCRREAAQAKVLASETLQAVASDGMQILASSGYAAESAMNRILRDSRLYTFGEGANDMLRDQIAREMGLVER
jgi:alkylation response protein AidB-like acyl-CoA dehydrogenase